jgi:hypothetical protein
MTAILLSRRRRNHPDLTAALPMAVKALDSQGLSRASI